ncbi:hypothetical protein AUP68_04239 [Ilyonectria robusta]
MNLEPGSLAHHSPLPTTASASKGEGEEFRTNSYPAPPMNGQRNDDFDYSYDPTYNHPNPFNPNPRGYNSNGYDPRFQYHSTNVYLQPPYINTNPQVAPPFAQTPSNPLTSRYYQSHFPYSDHAPQFDGGPIYPTPPRNDYNYIAEYEDISSSAATVDGFCMMDRRNYLDEYRRGSRKWHTCCITDSPPIELGAVPAGPSGIMKEWGLRGESCRVDKGGQVGLAQQRYIMQSVVRLAPKLSLIAKVIPSTLKGMNLRSLYG